MAINRSKKPAASVPDVPEKLAEMAETAFTAQQLGKCWQGVFEEEKVDILAWLEKSTEVQLSSTNKTVKIPSIGAITFKTRTNHEIDKDALVKLVESGRINVATLVEIASFTAKGLKDVLGSDFDAISTESETESLALTASSEFKAGIIKEFDEQFAKEVAKGTASTSKPAPKAKAKKKAPAKKKPKVAKDLSEAINDVKSAVETPDVDSDLAAILGE